MQMLHISTRRSYLAMTIVLVMSSFTDLMCAQSTAPLKLEKTIELPDVNGRIDHLAIDLKNRRLFVAALGNNTVEVIDIQGGKRIHTIPGLAEPQGLLALPEENRLFVANGKDGTVRMFDASSFNLLKTIQFGGDADNLRLDPSAKRIWVGYGGGALGSLDLEGNKIGDIALGAHPESFQLEKNGSRIFVNLPGSKKVAVVDRNKSAVVGSWGTGLSFANFPMALDEANKRLFIVCRTPARLLVLNTDSGATVAKLSTVGDSDDLFYDPSAKRLYASGGEGAIAVYQQEDADHYKEIARIETIKGARTSFFSADLGRFFLAVRRQDQKPAAVWVYNIAK